MKKKLFIDIILYSTIIYLSINCDRYKKKYTGLYHYLPLDTIIQQYIFRYYYYKKASIITNDKFISKFEIRKLHNKYKKNNNIILHIEDCMTLSLTDNLRINLLDRNILQCFATNCNFTHQKVTKVPIGIDNLWIPTKSNNNKIFKIYCDFHLNPDPYGERKKIYEKYKSNDLFHFIRYRKSIKDTSFYYSKYKFVLSVRGFGVDCHRIWETLSCGGIPIVFSSFLDDLYEQYPIIIINTLDNVTEDNLRIWYNKIKHKSINKLYISYWENEFKKYYE